MKFDVTSKIEIGPFLIESWRRNKEIGEVVYSELEVRRCDFFFRDKIDLSLAPYGKYFDDINFKNFRHYDPIVVPFAQALVLGVDGVVITDGVALLDTVRHLPTWIDTCLLQEKTDNHLTLKNFRSLIQLEHRGSYFLGFSGSWRNHSHWLVESLPKLQIFKQLRKRNSELKLVLPNMAGDSKQSDALKLSAIDEADVMFVDFDQINTFENLLVMSALDIWSVSSLVRAQADNLTRAWWTNATAQPQTRGVFIKRSRSGTVRHVSNLPEVERVLEDQNVEVVEFEKATLSQQIEKMQNARFVIAEHGAGLSNLIFCRAGTPIIELFSPTTVQPAHWSLASLLGLPYGFVVGRHSPTERYPNPDWNSDYHLDPIVVGQAIEAANKMAGA